MIEPPPNIAAVPCGSDPQTHQLMSLAAPCRCGSRQLVPVCDAQAPPTFAIACDGCGVILGDAPSFARAVASWNNWTEAPHGHAWVPTESDAEEICCLCGAYPNTPDGLAACPEPEAHFTDDEDSAAPP